MSPSVSFAQEEKSSGVIDCEKAEFSYLEKNIDEALIYLKRCRQALPDYLPGLTLLGKIQSDYERHDLAVNTFQEALSQGADAELFAREWATSLLASRQFKTLVEFSGFEQFAPAARVQWLEARAQACIELDDESCARSSYSQLESLTKGVVAPLGFAGIAINNKNWQLAEQQLAIAASRAKDDIRVLVGYSKLAVSQGQTEQALNYVNQALDKSPGDPLALRVLVDVYLASNKLDQAAGTLDVILQKSPNDPFAMLVSNSLKPNEKYATLLNTVKSRIEQYNKETKSTNKELYYLQGLIAFQEGSYEQALKSFNYLEKNRYYYPQSLTLLAKTFVALGQPAEAIKVLETKQDRLLEDAPETMALLIELFVEEGTIFKALPSWRSLSERYPNRLDVKLLEVKILFGRGLDDQAMEKLTTLTQQYPESEAVLRVYAVSLTRAGQLNEALEIVDRLMNQAEQKAPWYNFKGALYLMLKQQDKAKQALESALQEDSGLLTARLNLAWLRFEQGEQDTALKEVTQLRAQYPSHQMLRQLYAGMLLSAGRFEDSTTEYEELLKLDNTNRSVIETLVTLYQNSEQFDKVIELLGRLIELEYDTARNYIRRAQVFVYTDQKKRAEVDLYKALPLSSGQPALMLSIAHVSLQIGLERLAINSLQQARRLAPKDPLPLIKLVELMLNLDQTEEASKLLNESSETFAGVPELWLVKGRLAEQQGNAKLAAEYYHRVLKINPDFDLAFAKLYSLTRYNVGNAAFEKALLAQIEAKPETVFTRSLLAQYYYYNQRFDEAAPLYHYLYEHANSDVKKAGYARRVAQSYFHFNVSQAISYVDIATELNPQDPFLLGLKGWAQVQQGEQENGLKLLRQAFTQNGDDLDVQYFIAYTLSLLKLNKEAKEMTKPLIESNVQFAYRQEALQLYEKLF